MCGSTRSPCWAALQAADDLLGDAVIMTVQARKAEHFRELHLPGQPFVLFNIWDAVGGNVTPLAPQITVCVMAATLPRISDFELGLDRVRSSGRARLARLSGSM